MHGRATADRSGAAAGAAPWQRPVALCLPVLVLAGCGRIDAEQVRVCRAVIGSLPGAMLGGLLIAAIETVWAAYLPSAGRDVAAFALLTIVLVFRPSFRPDPAPIRGQA